jgi:AraC-like DNA-binding protein
MKAIPLIRVNTVLPFVDFLNRIGTPTESLLKEIKLPTFGLDDAETLIPRHQVFEFLERAACQEAIDNLGLLVGQQTSVGNLGAFGRILCQSLTLYDALSTLVRIYPIFNSGERYWLVQQGEQICLSQQYFDLLDTNPHHAALYSLMLMVDLIQMATGKRWHPQEVYLQSCRTSSLAEIELLSEAQIHGGVSFTGITFPRSLLSLPLQPRLNLSERQRQQNYSLLESSAPELDFVSSLKQAIATLLRDGYPDIYLASQITGTSPRTLQRRLAEEGLTYFRLVEQVRFDTAIGLLQDPSFKLLNIAIELGYSDAAHFTRAFKRWTGTSPSEFRHLNAECDR